MGMSIVDMINDRLNNITINIPEKNIIVKSPDNIVADNDATESFINFVQDNKSDIQGFYKKNAFSAFQHKTVITDDNLCQSDHSHKTCKYGNMNYPDPRTLSPLDLRYFKYNYPNNFTLQDYINWLWLFKNTKEDLPYEHIKNFKKLFNGIILKYEKDIIPPNSKVKLPLSTAEYFNKMYNDKIDIREPFTTELPGLKGYNSCYYPKKIEK